MMEESSCCARCVGLNPMMAWTVRDYGHEALGEMRWLRDAGARYCMGAEGVLRYSLGCSLFFVMFLSTMRTRKVHDYRNSWHSECWPVKLVHWFALTVVPFFAPSPPALLTHAMLPLPASFPRDTACAKSAHPVAGGSSSSVAFSLTASLD